MSMTDPVADFLTRIRNAHLVKHDRVDIPASKLRTELCRILKEEGFIRSVQVIEGHPQRMLRIFLSYSQEGIPVITHLQRVSRPGRRVYRGADEIHPVLNGIGVGIISTSLGLLTDAQARERRVGGEILCEIW